VRDGESIDFHLADAKAFPGLKGFDNRLELSPGNGWGGETAEVDRYLQLAKDRNQPAHVIAVFV